MKEQVSTSQLKQTTLYNKKILNKTTRTNKRFLLPYKQNTKILSINKCIRFSNPYSITNEFNLYELRKYFIDSFSSVISKFVLKYNDKYGHDNNLFLGTIEYVETNNAYDMIFKDEKKSGNLKTKLKTVDSINKFIEDIFSNLINIRKNNNYILDAYDHKIDIIGLDLKCFTRNLS